MIEDLGALRDDVGMAADLAVVGAGPAGIVVALEAAKQGISVVLIESGGRTFDQSVQELAEAAQWDRSRHAPLHLTTRRQVGGTSNIWGGRCVPYDPVDFDVMLKLGQTYNNLKDDQEAVKWFNLAQLSPESSTAMWAASTDPAPARSV